MNKIAIFSGILLLGSSILWQLTSGFIFGLWIINKGDGHILAPPIIVEYSTFLSARISVVMWLNEMESSIIIKDGDFYYDKMTRFYRYGAME